MLKNRLRASLLVSAASLFAVHPADAQSIAQVPADELEAPAQSDIVVTGSRISGSFNAPTPVTALGAADIEAQARSNISDLVNQLPAIAGSQTATSSVGSLSSGLAGIAAINLRALGAGRTLVLVDGQRSAASSATGLVDINTIPQQLVERVEVITGGASAAYGSDAVGGVVNFILKKDFEGVAVDTDFAQTNYGDGDTFRIAATAGMKLLDDRLHLVVSGEYFDQEIIPYVSRNWNNSAYFMINNPAYTASNGEPQRLVVSGAGVSQATPGGLITSGALQGTYFGTINPSTGRATVNQLAYGDVNGSWMLGGDSAYTLSNYMGTATLLPDETRYSAFARASFEVSPAFRVFGQFSYNRYEGVSYASQPTQLAAVTIRADNAYLPASIAEEMQASNIASFVMGTTNSGFPRTGTNMKRELYRYVVGADGEFGLLGNNWKWDAYFQHGTAKLNEGLTGIWNTAKLTEATDAVYAPAGNSAGIAAGTIVCRSTLTNPTNGCVPINRIGVGGVTQEALNYVIPEEQPYRLQTIKQSVAAATVSGALFDLPAGPVQMAIGAEYREESIDGFVEDQFMSGWYVGNFRVTSGSFNVKEAFAELSVPVLRGLELNAAARYTDYSLSGGATTWKLGATYDVVPGLRFRGNVSRDIRAPNLSELFAAGTSRTNTVTVPPSNAAISFLQFQTGNLDLRPEVADSWTIGTVLRPAFIPGLTFSADYYEIRINDAIGTVTAQQTVDLCYEKQIQQYCNAITFETVDGVQQISRILLVPFNFSSQVARGLDFELGYRTPLERIVDGVPGSLSFNAMATHYLENYVDTGVGTPTDSAGTNVGSGPPSWKYRASLTYNLERFMLNFTARGVSSGKYDNSYIECTSGCPTSTVDNRTINSNHIDGALYFDLATSYKIDVLGAKATVQLSIQNLFDRDPVLVASGPDNGLLVVANPQTNTLIYDYLGRITRIALKMKF